MLTIRRLLTVALALAFATNIGMAADPGDGWTGTRVDPTLNYEHVDTMYADLKACCGGNFVEGKGHMLARVWYDAQGDIRTNFSIDTIVAVPNKLEGFWSMQDAMDADVRVQFMRQPDGQYAECMLAFQGFEYAGGQGEAIARYGLTMRVVNGGVIKPINGICDIDMHMKGIQFGMPEMEFNDLLETVSVAAGERTRYLRGLCK